VRALPSTQQVADRHQVQRVGLDPTPPRDAALRRDLGRVDLHHLPASWQHALAQQRLVVVPGRLDPDPDQPDPPTGGRHRHPLDQLRDPGPVHREPERPGQQLPCEVAHQRGRLPLADIDGTAISPPGSTPRVPRANCWARRP
jgi:hypothetical protein